MRTTKFTFATKEQYNEVYARIEAIAAQLGKEVKWSVVKQLFMDRLLAYETELNAELATKQGTEPTRLEQVRAFVAQGITSAKEIVEKLGGSHYSYIWRLVKQVKAENAQPAV